MTEGVLGVLRRLVFNVGETFTGTVRLDPVTEQGNVTFVEPRPHPLAAKLNILDLPEIGEDLLEMIFVDIPGESPDVNLSGWR